MDYILFNGDFNKKEIKLDFGFGLNSKFPAKSPLHRNLVSSLKGDNISFENDSILDDL